jgi:hypothetical protein
MSTITLEPAITLGATIGARTASGSRGSLDVLIPEGEEFFGRYFIDSPAPAGEDEPRKIRAKMARMRDLAERRRREAPSYADDERALAEQAAVTSAFMPLQLEAMRNAER